MPRKHITNEQTNDEFQYLSCGKAAEICFSSYSLMNYYSLMNHLCVRGRTMFDRNKCFYGVFQKAWWAPVFLRLVLFRRTVWGADHQLTDEPLSLFFAAQV